MIICIINIIKLYKYIIMNILDVVRMIYKLSVLTLTNNNNFDANELSIGLKLSV